MWTAEIFVAGAGTLTEGPIWDDRTGRLLWVDIYPGSLRSCDASGGDRWSTSTGQPLGSFAPREGGGYVLALETGLALSGEDVSDWTPVGEHRTLPSTLRSNDGGCDQAGRFFAGTMAHDEAPHAGALYRLDAVPGDVPDAGRSGPVAVIEGTTVSNGLDWSVDGTRLYYADSEERRVDVLDYDLATGELRDRRPLVVCGPDDGLPDGLVVDAEDHLWVAFWGGGVVRRFSPDGALVGVVELPVSQVTSCTFGGDDLGELFITTASYELSPAALAEQPLAGSIFRCRPGVVGRPLARYAG